MKNIILSRLFLIIVLFCTNIVQIIRADYRRGHEISTNKWETVNITFKTRKVPAGNPFDVHPVFLQDQNVTPVL